MSPRGAASALPSGTRPRCQRKNCERDPPCRAWVPGLAALARDMSPFGRIVVISRCQTAQCCSFPRRVVAPGFSSFPFASIPERRGGRSADRRTCSVVAFARRDGSARVRRGASHDAGRSPLGAPPWRFSAGGRASISGIASGSVQRAPRSQVVMPGGRCPGPPEPAVTSRGRRTPLPAPPFRTVSGRRPSMSEDGESYTINPLRSQADIFVL